MSVDTCPLCGAALRWWDRAEPTRCDNCGVTVNPEPFLTLWDTVAAEHDELIAPNTNAAGKAQTVGQSDTSKVAARLAYPRSGTQRWRVLTLLASTTLTDEEIQHRLGMNPNTERPRRVELVEGGWVEDSGERRNTASERPSVVWRLTAKGRAWA